MFRKHIPRRGRQKYRKAGFTLIELLVVLGIIGILASLILPAVLKVKHRAAGVNCLSNLRQYNIGLHDFLQRTREYPLEINFGPAFGEYSEHPSSWMEAIFGSTTIIASSIQDQNQNDYRGVLRCPAARRPSGLSKGTGFSYYGYNAVGYRGNASDTPLGVGFVDLGPGKGRPVREDEVKNPTQMIAFGDGLVGWNATIEDGRIRISRDFVAQDNLGSTSRAQARHQGKANIAFCDGHVDSPRLRQLFSDTSEDSLRLWNRDNTARR